MPGRLVGRTCRKPAPKLRRKRACTRYQTVAKLARAGGTGVNRIAFRYLSPKYRARMPSLPAHKAVQVNYDYKWWSAHGDQMSKQWNTWIHS